MSDKPGGTSNASATGFEAYDARPWTKHYAEGIEPDLENLGCDHLGDLVSQASREFGASPAFTTCLPTGTTGTLTFAQVDRLTDQFAAYLRHELGLKKGDRVAISAQPRPVVSSST